MALGFFGYTAQAKGAPQPRWKSRRSQDGAPDAAFVAACASIESAIVAVTDVLAVWREVAQWPDAQPFTGGVFDAWPHRLARGLAVCRAEAQAVRDYLTSQQKAVAHG